VSPTRGKKTPKYRNFEQIFTFLGLLCPSFFTDLGHIWQETVDRGLCLRAKFRLDWYRLFCCTRAAENSEFCRFLDFDVLWCRQLVALWRKLNTLHNNKPPFPYPTASESFLGL